MLVCCLNSWKYLDSIQASYIFLAANIIWRLVISANYSLFRKLTAQSFNFTIISIQHIVKKQKLLAPPQPRPVMSHWGRWWHPTSVFLATLGADAWILLFINIILIDFIHSCTRDNAYDRYETTNRKWQISLVMLSETWNEFSCSSRDDLRPIITSSHFSKLHKVNELHVR